MQKYIGKILTVENDLAPTSGTPGRLLVLEATELAVYGLLVDREDLTLTRVPLAGKAACFTIKNTEPGDTLVRQLYGAMSVTLCMEAHDIKDKEYYQYKLCLLELLLTVDAKLSGGQEPAGDEEFPIDDLFAEVSPDEDLDPEPSTQVTLAIPMTFDKKELEEGVWLKLQIDKNKENHP